MRTQQTETGDPGKMLYNEFLSIDISTCYLYMKTIPVFGQSNPRVGGGRPPFNGGITPVTEVPKMQPMVDYAHLFAPENAILRICIFMHVLDAIDNPNYVLNMLTWRKIMEVFIKFEKLCHYVDFFDEHVESLNRLDVKPFRDTKFVLLYKYMCDNERGGMTFDMVLYHEFNNIPEEIGVEYSKRDEFREFMYILWEIEPGESELIDRLLLTDTKNLVYAPTSSQGFPLAAFINHVDETTQYYYFNRDNWWPIFNMTLNYLYPNSTKARQDLQLTEVWAMALYNSSSGWDVMVNNETSVALTVPDAQGLALQQSKDIIPYFRTLARVEGQSIEWAKVTPLEMRTGFASEDAFTDDPGYLYDETLDLPTKRLLDILPLGSVISDVFTPMLVYPLESLVNSTWFKEVAEKAWVAELCTF
jgi:hypothetical protein